MIPFKSIFAKYNTINSSLLVCFLPLFLIQSSNAADNQKYLSHEIVGGTLVVSTVDGEVRLTSLAREAIEVQVVHEASRQMPSFAKSETVKFNESCLKETEQSISIMSGKLRALLNKSDLSISFYRNGNLLTRQKNYFHKSDKRGFDFTLVENEKIMGGGQRVLGMDRRGHRMPLYNKAHYGYTTESNQMYFGLPVIMSSKKYAIVFDNSASGFLDIGKTDKNTLTFEAVSGRSAYLVFAGETYPELIEHYVDVTGRQPLPPRWAFGNYASRFGYRNQQEVQDTVDKFLEKDFPLDTLILDLYWFGPDIKGHVGNLDWDKKAFPEPVAMIKYLKDKGVKTILITEPFILSSSSHWKSAVENKILAKNEKGEPQRFDFYFGNTGLIDIFDENARQWFWKIYRGLFEQGVAGTWGDLGEPEVHPDDILHFLSDVKQSFRGDELHNVYGHEWAKMVFENQLEFQPNTRPFIMMRSGFAGSQRYGMVPWTGDVSRSWGGLKPQVELSLQMGLMGMAYNHSDLGGFAGGEVFDKELYIRWLQYGVFQPIYRPHAQDNIAPEPIFHDEETQNILREYIKLRYRLLPYNYTLAYENATTGMPLMRPVFFDDEDNLALFDVKDLYYWGDAFLVSPIVNPNETKHAMQLPKGVWFDYWDGTRYLGNQRVEIPINLSKLPVMVKAGAFIPMVEEIKTTDNYSSEKLTLHYYADASVQESSGQMYEDDGTSFDSIASRKFELLNFEASHSGDKLSVILKRQGDGFQNMPETRELTFIAHNIGKKPKKISFAGKRLKAQEFGGGVETGNYVYDADSHQLTLKVNWDHSDVAIAIEK